MRAWFLGGGWILVAGALVVLGLVTAAAVLGATRRKRAYSRDHARHAWYEPEAAHAAGAVTEQDFYGSMTLEGERPLRLPGQEAREAMLADLSPGALDEFYEWANYCTPHCPDDTCRAFGECAWRVETEDGWGWVDRCPTPDRPVSPLDPDGRWDRGPELHVQESSNLSPSLDPGPGAAVETPSSAPGPDLGRLAWLDQQLAAHADWARRMRGQVTGWGLAAAA